jgi:Fe-S cluster assembly protein SufB
VIPPGDNKFAALNSSVWLAFYVPPGVHVEMPLQAYFRINSESTGQFERTLIIADEVRRCTTSRAARRRCSTDSCPASSRTIEAERAHPLHDHQERVAERLQPRHQAGAAETEATVEWIDGNLGSSSP